LPGYHFTYFDEKRISIDLLKEWPTNQEIHHAFLEAYDEANVLMSSLDMTRLNMFQTRLPSFGDAFSPLIDDENDQYSQRDRNELISVLEKCNQQGTNVNLLFAYAAEEIEESRQIEKECLQDQPHANENTTMIRCAISQLINSSLNQSDVNEYSEEIVIRDGHDERLLQLLVNIRKKNEWEEARKSVRISTLNELQPSCTKSGSVDLNVASKLLAICSRNESNSAENQRGSKRKARWIGRTRMSNCMDLSTKMPGILRANVNSENPLKIGSYVFGIMNENPEKNPHLMKVRYFLLILLLLFFYFYFTFITSFFLRNLLPKI